MGRGRSSFSRVIAMVVFSMFLLPSTGSGESGISLTNVSKTTLGSRDEIPFERYGGGYCSYKTVQYKNSDVGELNHSGCFVYSDNGETDGEIIQSKYHTKYVRFYQDEALRSPFTFTPIANSQHGFGTYRSDLFFYKNLVANVQNVAVKNSTNTYNKYGAIPKDSSSLQRTYLRYDNGDKIPVSVVSRGESAEGDWQTILSTNKELVLTSLEDFSSVALDTMPFGTSSTQQSSLRAKTYVSSKADYVLVKAGKIGFYRLYDLTCDELRRTVCASGDITPYLQEVLNGEFIEVSHVRFTNKPNVEIYATTLDENSKAVYHKLVFSIGDVAVPNFTMDLLAMGDSFTSGEGAHAYRQETDIAINRCHQSHLSYPYLLGDWLEMDRYASVACSGNKTRDIDEKDQIEFNEYQRLENRPQYNQKLGEEYDDELFDSFIPGYRPQWFFVGDDERMAGESPEVLIVSIGGNDAKFSGIIMECIRTDTDCFLLPEDQFRVANQIYSIKSGLEETFTRLKNSTPESKIYAIGYPEMFDTNNTSKACPYNTPFSLVERRNAQTIVRYLNHVIEATASEFGIGYIDVSKSMYGYRLCEDVPKELRAFNGLSTNGETYAKFGPAPTFVGPESFHPTELGHSFYAGTIRRQTEDFTLDLIPNVTLQGPESAFDLDPVLYEDAPIYSVNNSQLAPELVVQGEEVEVEYQPQRLAPDGEVTATLHSDPITLGTFTFGQPFSFVVPEGVEPGLHRVVIDGFTVLGEPIQEYDYVWVAVSDDDYDGDNIPNDQELCFWVEPAGLDNDQDGIDDACDPDLSTPIQDQPGEDTPDDTEFAFDVPNYGEEKYSDLDQFSNQPTQNTPTTQNNNIVQTQESDLSPQPTNQEPETAVAAVKDENNTNETTDPTDPYDQISSYANESKYSNNSILPWILILTITLPALLFIGYKVKQSMRDNLG